MPGFIGAATDDGMECRHYLDLAGRQLVVTQLHDLRHTAASPALQAGVPMKVVSEQLGHSSLSITADTYTSVLPAVAPAAAEAVADTVPRRSWT